MEVSGQLHAPATLLPGEKPRPRYHCIGACMSPTVGLGSAEFQTRVFQPIAHRYTDRDIPAPN
jgi:hypothetical protein